MASDSDPFELFAAQRALRISAEELCVAPRDVLAPPADLERHILVVLAGPTQDAPLRIMFVTASTDPRLPTIRDMLWWLASDSWAIEQAKYDYRGWTALYNYPDSDSAAPRLFELHLAQARALATLLGEAGYAELLSLYEGEMTAGGARTIESLVLGARGGTGEM